MTTMSENQIELDLITKLGDLKYSYRHDIRDRAALEANFREKFQELNQVTLTDSEFQRLSDEIVSLDVFTAVHTLRNRNAFSQLGHWGTGDLELSLTSQTDLETAKPLILMSYQGRPQQDKADLVP